MVAAVHPDLQVLGKPPKLPLVEAAVQAISMNRWEVTTVSASTPTPGLRERTEREDKSPGTAWFGGRMASAAAASDAFDGRSRLRLVGTEVSSTMVAVR